VPPESTKIFLGDHEFGLVFSELVPTICGTRAPAYRSKFRGRGRRDLV